MKVTVQITNAYLDETVKRTVSLNVPPPSGDLDEWADDNLFPETGCGREDSHAVYTVNITHCTLPVLIGKTFEWSD